MKKIMNQWKEEQSSKGRIFNIQKFSIDDGPGIRTLVFLKGCPLHCPWCSNPESQAVKAQVMYYLKKCRGCGKCMKICPKNCIMPDEQFGLLTDHSTCIGCGTCVDSCFFNARELLGKDYTEEELMQIILQDYDFYKNSGGGVTFSGGEVMMQPAFLLRMLRCCKEQGIHTAIETCGYAPWESFQDILPYTDLIFYDFKHFDSNKHKQYTGVDNRRIKDNLQRLNLMRANVIVRIPYIPGFNDGFVTMEKMITELRTMRTEKVEILPYHRIGKDKYVGLGKQYVYEDLKSLKADTISFVEDIGRNLGIEVTVRGLRKQKR